MLVDFRRDNQFWKTVPDVNLFSIIVKTDKPLVGTWPKRKHWKSVVEVMLPGRNIHFSGRPTPDQLAVAVEKSDAVHSFAKLHGRFNGKPDGNRRELSEGVRIFAVRFGDFPFQEAALAARAAMRGLIVTLHASHGGFIG